QAIQLDPDAPQAQLALAGASYCAGDWGEAEKYFRATLQLNPRYALARHWHAPPLRSQGPLHLGLEKKRKGEELDPLAFITVDRAAEMQVMAQRYDKALETNLRAATLRPNPFLRNLGNRAQLLTLLRRQKEAADVARAIRQDQSPRTRWIADA